MVIEARKSEASFLHTHLFLEEMVEAVEAEAIVGRQPHGLAIAPSSLQYPPQRPCMLLQESHFGPESSLDQGFDFPSLLSAF
jgi:hypothetical protein